jgi:superfamily I DNA and RNA helicase
MLGNQVFEKGQIRFDTAYRFKGQQSPAVILTDVDPDERNLDHALRLIFSGATRATVRLEMLVRGDNPAVQGFLQ